MQSDKARLAFLVWELEGCFKPEDYNPRTGWPTVAAVEEIDDEGDMEVFDQKRELAELLAKLAAEEETEE